MASTKINREFIQLETVAGILLFVTAVLALIISNTPWRTGYNNLFSLPLTVQLGAWQLSKPFLLWVNDGFMAIFFLLVGLEIKREMFVGELNSMQKVTLPTAAAVGGMLLPALIYYGWNHGDAFALQGWAIPTATDIAFSLGILALLGSRVPATLKIFLTALAIFDDMGAIAIIAVFYTRDLSLVLLLAAAGLVIVLLLFNRFKVTLLTPYLLVGGLLWLCVLQSGVHATLSGVVLAFSIPLGKGNVGKTSPLHRLERALHPWVAFGVLPLFAFANSGVSFAGLGRSYWSHPIPLGIICGLFIGKQLGIWLSSYLTVRMGFARMPRGTCWWGIYGIGLIAGVGFTMSLFIGTLAFGTEPGDYTPLVRIGVIVGSLLSGCLGYWVLRWTYRSSEETHP